MATLQRTLVNAALRTPSVQHVASLPFQCLLGARASLTTEPAQGANTSVESTTARSEEDTARRRRPQYAPSALPRTCQTLSAWWHHPSALLHHRACRTQAASIASDAIHIRGARFFGYHGVLPAENQVGQPFVVDVTLYADLRDAGRSDDLTHTVSYADVFTIMQRIVEGPPHKLLESVAHRVATSIMQAHAPVHAVRVSISKTHIPAQSAAVQSVGIEVYRERSDLG